MEPYKVQGLSVFASERSPAQTGLDFLKNGAGETFIPNTKALSACGLWATGLRCSSDKIHLVPLDGGFLLHQDPPTPPWVMADGPPHLQT